MHKQSLCPLVTVPFGTQCLSIAHMILELLSEETLWDKRRHECDFKACVGNFWLLCSIFPLFDCLYWIQNWVFFQLDTFQWVIWWCELSKGRCELNCMWQVNVTRGGLIITEYALRKSRGWQMSSLNELQTQDRLSATERDLSCKPALVISLLRDTPLQRLQSLILPCPVDTLPTTNGTNMDLFALLPVTV